MPTSNKNLKSPWCFESTNIFQRFSYPNWRSQAFQQELAGLSKSLLWSIPPRTEKVLHTSLLSQEAGVPQSLGASASTHIWSASQDHLVVVGYIAHACPLSVPWGLIEEQRLGTRRRWWVLPSWQHSPSRWETRFQFPIKTNCLVRDHDGQICSCELTSGSPTSVEGDVWFSVQIPYLFTCCVRSCECMSDTNLIPTGPRTSVVSSSDIPFNLVVFPSSSAIAAISFKFFTSWSFRWSLSDWKHFTTTSSPLQFRRLNILGIFPDKQ